MKLLARCGQGSELFMVGAKLLRNGTADVITAGLQRVELKPRGSDSTLGSGFVLLTAAESARYLLSRGQNSKTKSQPSWGGSSVKLPFFH